jgi:hypothetical protein
MRSEECRWFDDLSSCTLRQLSGTEFLKAAVRDQSQTLGFDVIKMGDGVRQGVSREGGDVSGLVDSRITNGWNS